MADKKQITVNLDTDSIAKMDKLCEKISMNRAQMLRFLFSGNPKNIRFVCDTLEGLCGGSHDE